MPCSEQAYSFLFNKFVCVVALADKEQAEVVERGLNAIPLLKVITHTTSATAETAILSQDRVHCCVCGTGFDDRHGHELHLLKRFGDHIPFIMLLPGTRVMLGAECMRFDAAAVLEQEQLGPGSARLLVAVCNQIVKGVLFPLRSLRIIEPLRRSLEVMFRKKPAGVIEWALQCDMSRQYVRKLWSDHCGATANLSLICHQLLCSAFTYYLNQALEQDHRNTTRSCLQKQQSCTRKYYNHLASLQRMMFRKRAYSLLPVREYEHIGFYDVITMPCDPAAEQKKLLSV